MEAHGGNDFGVLSGQLKHRRPVTLSCSVHDHLDYPGFNSLGEGVFTDTIQSRVLQVIMGIVEAHHSLPEFSRAKARILSQTRERLLRRFGERCCVIPTCAKNDGSTDNISRGE